MRTRGQTAFCLAGKPVDRRESHLHLKLLAECGCLIGKVASLGPMDIHFLQRDQVG